MTKFLPRQKHPRLHARRLPAPPARVSLLARAGSLFASRVPRGRRRSPETPSPANNDRRHFFRCSLGALIGGALAWAARPRPSLKPDTPADRIETVSVVYSQTHEDNASPALRPGPATLRVSFGAKEAAGGGFTGREILSVRRV